MGAIDRVRAWYPALLLAGCLLASDLAAGPKIEHWQSANGARVLFVAAPDLPMVNVRVVFDAGSARDAALPGLADMTNDLLNEGAGPWDADQIAQRLAEVGARLGSGSARDMAWVSVRTLTEEVAFERTLETLVEVLARPRFATKDLQRLRNKMQTALRLDEQKPGTLASKAFYRSLYGDHPYATPEGGTQASLERIDSDDVRAFHQRYYVANNAVIAIVGAVSRQQAEQIAQRVSSGLPPGEAAEALPEVAALAAGQQIRQRFPSSQSHILIGQPGLYRGDPDYFPLYVGNHILGGSGLVSRLSEEVREKRGLSYSVYSYFSPMRRHGPFIVGAQTQNAKAAQAMEVIRSTLQRFQQEGPSDEELTAAKQNITGGFPLRVASNGNIVEYLAMIGFYRLPFDYLDRFVERINSVTREQIHDAFGRRLDLQRLITVVVGDDEAAQPEG
ncbi:MAG: insulinase family protein [Gammaproteobacteria bacterium]|nr:insulinase family protein [Gammaproteobacteria bacterium]